jgi:long-chain acyl-CoA synthetase
MFQMINKHPGVSEGRYNLRMIKACISGSAPLPEIVRQSFEKFTGGHLVEGYGLSEAPTATHCNPILGNKITGSIGLPLPDVDCRLVSIDGKEREVPMGSAGELLIKGPQVMPGYYEEPEETAATLEGGWLHTGDVASMDEQGYYFIHGRLKDLIKVHGLQVWPGEVEEKVVKLAGIKECAVAGVPDEISGERVKIWIVPVESDKLTLVDIRDFCRDKLAGYKIPSELEICQSIPRSPVGKVLRRELIRMHMEQHK